MASPTNYVAYFDMLGVGDASADENESYHDQLLRFRQAICDAVDKQLKLNDRVFAFSDCAFVSSTNIARLCSFVSDVQVQLWEQSLFFKGAIVQAKLEYKNFSDLPMQSPDLVGRRQEKLSGYWFSKESVRPAIIEKNLKGIAIQIERELGSNEWIRNNSCYSAHYPIDSTKRPTPILDLLIPQKNLRYLGNILKQYLLISHTSRRHSRYYIPILITWINSHDFKDISYNPAGDNYPAPLRQLGMSRKLAFEISRIPGGYIIYYALLSKIQQECHDEKIIEEMIDIIGSSRMLRSSAEFVPPEICSKELCKRVNETRIQQFFK